MKILIYILFVLDYLYFFNLFKVSNCAGQSLDCPAQFCGLGRSTLCPDNPWIACARRGFEMHKAVMKDDAYYTL